MMTENRRQADKDLTCIKVSLARIESTIQHHFEAEKEHRSKCDAERDILFGKVGKVDTRVNTVETKQKLITWIGGSVAITWIGVIAKWISGHAGK